MQTDNLDNKKNCLNSQLNSLDYKIRHLHKQTDWYPKDCLDNRASSLESKIDCPNNTIKSLNKSTDCLNQENTWNSQTDYLDRQSDKIYVY